MPFSTLSSYLNFPLTYVPGGLNIQGEDDAYDFGSGAGFYVDATKAPYNAGYNMYSYVTEELPKTVFDAFPQLDASRVSITGHSMGGHGALTLVCSVSNPHFIFFIFFFHLSGTILPHPQYKLTSPVPPQPRQIQVRLCLCTNHKPNQLPLGPKGIQGLLRRRPAKQVERARCHRAD